MAVDLNQPDAQAQLAALNAELVTLRKQNEEIQATASKAQLGEQRARALKDFTTVDEDVLNFYHGDAAGLYEFAKKWNDKMSASIPPVAGAIAGGAPPVPAVTPQTPAPAPGPGSNIPADTAHKLEMEELRAKAMDKDIDMGGKIGPNGFVSSVRGGSEARKYYEMAIGDGLREHFAKAKGR